MSSLGMPLFPSTGPFGFPKQDTFEWLGNLSSFAYRQGYGVTVASFNLDTEEKIQNLFWKVIAYTLFLPFTLLGWTFYALSTSYRGRISWCEAHRLPLAPPQAIAQNSVPQIIHSRPFFEDNPPLSLDPQGGGEEFQGDLRKISQSDAREIAKKLNCSPGDEYRQWRTLINYADGPDSLKYLKEQFFNAVYIALPLEEKLTEEEYLECLEFAIANENWEFVKDLLVSLKDDAQFRALASHIDCEDDEAFLSLLVALSHTNIADFSLSRDITPCDVEELSDRFSGDMNMEFPLAHWKAIAEYCKDEMTKKAVYSKASKFCMEELYNEYDSHLEKFCLDQTNLDFLLNLKSLSILKFTYYATQAHLNDESSHRIMQLLFQQQLSHLDKTAFRFLYYSLNQLQKTQEFSNRFMEWTKEQFEEGSSIEYSIIKCYILSYASHSVTPLSAQAMITDFTLQKWLQMAKDLFITLGSNPAPVKKKFSSVLIFPLLTRLKRKGDIDSAVSPSPSQSTRELIYEDLFFAQVIFDEINSEGNTPFSSTMSEWAIEALCKYCLTYSRVHFAREFLTYIFKKATLPSQLEAWDVCRKEIDSSVEYLKSLIEYAVGSQKAWLEEKINQAGVFSLCE